MQRRKEEKGEAGIRVLVVITGNSTAFLCLEMPECADRSWG